MEQVMGLSPCYLVVVLLLLSVVVCRRGSSCGCARCVC
jgi:hypothetical protein